MSPQDHADELVEAFEMLPSWDDRYGFMIDLARALLPFPDDERTEANYVHGCQSRVWVAAHVRPGTTDTLDFLADSDAIITKGLIAMLHKIYSGQQAQDILDFDIDGLLQQLELDQYLSLGRRNGLAGMVNRVKTLAREVA